MKTDFLAKKAVRSGQRAEQLADELTAFEEIIDSMAPPPAIRLSADGFDVIAEYKRKSPSQWMPDKPARDLRQQLSDYASSGAAMVSVLTEPDHFGGSMSDLANAARLMQDLAIPVMRKDFLVHPIQLYETRAAGAAAVLLIVRLLNDRELENMFDHAARLELIVLAETFDRTDLRRLGEISKSRTEQTILAGVNCRDLKTLQIRPERFFELAADLPFGLPAVAESGVTHCDQLRKIADAGYRLALIGNALMKSQTPGIFISGCLEIARKGPAAAGASG